MNRYRCLLGDLLAGIDDAARAGLVALDGPDAAAARGAALLAADRIEHVLSLVAPSRPVVPSVGPFAADARIAFGHVQELANRLAVEHASVDALADALEGIATAPGLVGRWRWHAIGVASRRIAGPFSANREHRIIAGTLANVADHVQRALSTIDPASVMAAAGAVTQDLGHATRALGRIAAEDPVRRAFEPHVATALVQIERLARAASLRGLGASPELGALKTATQTVRAAVQLSAVVAAVFAL